MIIECFSTVSKLWLLHFTKLSECAQFPFPRSLPRYFCTHKWSDSLVAKIIDPRTCARYTLHVYRDMGYWTTCDDFVLNFSVSSVAVFIRFCVLPSRLHDVISFIRLPDKGPISNNVHFTSCTLSANAQVVLPFKSLPPIYNFLFKKTLPHPSFPGPSDVHQQATSFGPVPSLRSRTVTIIPSFRPKNKQLSIFLWSSRTTQCTHFNYTSNNGSSYVIMSFVTLSIS